MTDLIDLLSAATEGSRELSDEVLIACGWTEVELNYAWWWVPPGVPWERVAEDRIDRTIAPNPTVSLDDTLSLVPKDRRPTLHQWDDERWTVALKVPGTQNHVSHAGATAALACCHAILQDAILRAKGAQRT